jgi:hypothetical protein
VHGALSRFTRCTQRNVKSVSRTAKRIRRIQNGGGGGECFLFRRFAARLALANSNGIKFSFRDCEMRESRPKEPPPTRDFTRRCKPNVARNKPNIE